MSFCRRQQSALRAAPRARRIGRVAALATAAALTMAACGGSSGGSSTTTTVKGAATTARAATASTAATTTVATTLPVTVATTLPTPTTVGYVAEPTTGGLKKGMKGNRVAAMQTKLRALGYDPGPADGLFGDKTDAAVRKFQGDKKLAVDGVAGNQTLTALDTACKAKGC